MKTIQKIRNFIKCTSFYVPIFHISQWKEMQDWKKSGMIGPLPHKLKQKILKDYAAKFNLNTLVETGTLFGDTVFATKNAFKAIFSIELDKDVFKIAQKRFKKIPHINIIQGDSTNILPAILTSIKEPCLFWLDAHYTGDVNETKGSIETPIVKEVEAILSHSVKNHIILIDDARLFVGKNDYPPLEWLKSYVLEKRPGWVFKVKNDIIRIYYKN